MLSEKGTIQKKSTPNDILASTYLDYQFNFSYGKWISAFYSLVSNRDLISILGADTVLHIIRREHSVRFQRPGGSYSRGVGRRGQDCQRPWLYQWVPGEV